MQYLQPKALPTPAIAPICKCMDTIDEILAKPSKAEKKLIQACAGNGAAKFGETRHNKATNANTIRAPLIHHLLLGNDDNYKPPTKGIAVMGAWVKGELDLQGAALKHPLKFVNCHFPNTINLRDAKTPALYLPGCYVHELDAHRLTCAGGVHLDNKFETPNTVDLAGANIMGDLACDGGKFLAETGRALNANAITVGADVFLRDGFEAKAEVNLNGATITGQLDCDGGKFLAETGRALNADAITVGDSVFLRGGFEAKAEVNLIGANITGQLDCDGGKFLAETGRALNADAITVGDSVFLRGGFTAQSAVYFTRADITGHLMVQNAHPETVFDAEGMTVGGGFYWNDITGNDTIVNLTDAKTGSLRDQPGAWRDVAALGLSGFRYDRIESDMTVAQRIRWLDKADRTRDIAFHESRRVVDQELKKIGFANDETRAAMVAKYLADKKVTDQSAQKFTPQPYVQLANVLRAQGNTLGANQVLVAREWKQRPVERDRAHAAMDGSWTAGLNSFAHDIRRPWNWLFGYVFGFGHQPARALAAVFCVWLGTAILYGHIYDQGQFAPTSDVVLNSSDWVQSFQKSGFEDNKDWVAQLDAWEETPSGRDYETFSRLLYALDLFVPLDALGQEKAWAPSYNRGPWGVAGYWGRWVIQMSGWMITAIGAAVVTGLVGRRD